MESAKLDPRISFCKHYWRISYRKYQDTKSARQKARMRKQMSEAVKTMIAILRGEL